jgi:hypothetical protein
MKIMLAAQKEINNEWRWRKEKFMRQTDRQALACEWDHLSVDIINFVKYKRENLMN